MNHALHKMPELEDAELVPPPPSVPSALKRQQPGYDMRTLRRQVDLLTSEIEQRVQELLVAHAQPRVTREQRTAKSRLVGLGVCVGNASRRARLK